MKFVLHSREAEIVFIEQLILKKKRRKAFGHRVLPSPITKQQLQTKYRLKTIYLSLN